MATLTDPQILRCYTCALKNWKYEGYVNFKRIAQEWVRANFGEFDLKEVARLLYEHVGNGGEIDQQTETRPEWTDSEYHYDLRVPIAGRLIYFETLLEYDDPNDPDDPYITVVSVHDA